MKIKKVEKNTLIVLALILVLMIIPGVYFDIIADDHVTLVDFIKTHVSMFVVIFPLLIVACYTSTHFIYNKVDKFNRSNSINLNPRKKSLYIYWLIIFLCWLPYLIICFPASSTGWDYSWQLLQGSGVVPLSNHHPVLGSMIYGLLYKIGFTIGGANGGLFFTGFFQVTLMSFAMAFGIFTVKRMGVPKKLVCCLLLFTCINPVFAGHAIWLIKDSIYSSLIVILLTLCLCYRLDRDQLFYPILIGIVGFFAAMYRNEGIIVVSLLIIALIVDVFRNSRKNLRIVIIAFASVLIVFISFKIGFRVSGIPSTSAARESMTLFSAQIMDCLKKHPSDVKEQEKDVLQKSYENLDATVLKYDEINRDPVKTVNMDFGETVDFLKVWFQLGMRHKGDYIDSFLHGTDGYWWIFTDPKLIAHSTPLYAPEEDFANTGIRDTPVMGRSWLKSTYQSYGIETDKTIGELVLENNPDLEGIFYVKSSFPNTRESLKEFLDKLKEIPLLQFIFVPGFYFVASLISLGYLYIRKRPLFWQCIPIMIIVLFNFFSPINGYMRYFLPVALSSVLMIGMCFTGKESTLSGDNS